MKKVLFAIFISNLVALVAHADVLRCDFSDPFFNVEYSAMTREFKTTKRLSATQAEVTTIQNVVLNTKNSLQLELVTLDNHLLMSLQLTNKGSSGLSTTLYPFEAQLKNELNETLVGGCESDSLSASKPEKEQSIED